MSPTLQTNRQGAQEHTPDTIVGVRHTGGEPALTRSATLVLEDGTRLTGRAFGAPRSIAGEVVFNTGMVGYPESLTDPSYMGQILVCTYPLVGNYGVPDDRVIDGLSHVFESDRVQISGLVVADYSLRYSHWNARRSLGQWLDSFGIPGITGIDTRTLTQKLRERGSMLGSIVVEGVIEGDAEPEPYDPNHENLVAKASITEPIVYGTGDRRIALLDCGAKHNIIHCLVSRGLQVLRLPWDADLTQEKFDGLMISNGPGDPAYAMDAAKQVAKVIDKSIPTFGICMGNQILALAIGAETYKLKYGHRGQNQPVIECGTNRCFVTSQNHGFAVDTESLPRDWRPWFENLNDRTNEGIRHAWAPFRSVQFHPEAAPGPVDGAFLFDEFIRMMK
ncbi:MAG: glutamine-hydrolyzing carbamoyl-phosphate synthase small subunit [Phycisphaerales bacterium]